MIIMDMVVMMADGSIANIEIQKISYDFQAELNALKVLSDEKEAEIERLKKLLEERK